MRNYGIAFALVSGLVIGCGGDSGGDEAADTAGDSTTATTPATATETSGVTQTSVTETDATVTITATETGATTEPGDSSGGSSGPADSSSGGDSTTEAVVSASATLEPKSGSSTMGTAVFTDNGDGTASLVIELTGVEPVDATHALHIHEVPDCSAEDGTSTGDHWNPPGTMLGELGTVDIAGDGTGTFMKMDAWSIGTGRDNDVVDHSIIIHEAPDGGTRIACGVITLD